MLLRVFSSPRGAHLSVKHGHWVRDLVREVGLVKAVKEAREASEAREATREAASEVAVGSAEELVTVLRHLECVVQPALLLLEHGTETLANSIQSLLQGRPSDLMTLRTKSASRGASPIREHCAVLTAAFRVLLGSVARKQVRAVPASASCASSELPLAQAHPLALPSAGGGRLVRGRLPAVAGLAP